MNNSEYDVVIVGSGITGALIAWKLSLEGKKVLILEAGREDDVLQDNIDRYYSARIKVPGAPYLNEQYAPRQNAPGVGIDGDSFVDWKDKNKNYWEQTGKSAFDSTYERTMGGTTRHWLGTCLRFLPNDFKIAEVYKIKNAMDWPLRYEDLEKYYSDVEKFIGVAGDPTWDNDNGATHKGKYPMVPVPMSWGDLQIKELLEGKEVASKKLDVISTPQARVTYTDGSNMGKGYDNRPECMGNTSCVPVCPINAKYNATVHIKKATAPLVTAFDKISGRIPAVLQTHSVVYQVEIDPETDMVCGIKYYRWEEGKGYTDEVVSASVYILATHAMENPKILLNSPWKDGKTVANSSDQVGRNLMDHICLIRWGLMPEGKPVYGYRGPLSTAGIPNFRDDPALRPNYAAYRIEIGNEGWAWPASAPISTVNDLVNGVQNKKTGEWDQIPLYGKELKKKLHDLVPRQIRFSFELESIGESESKVTLSEEKDALGIPRPKVNYVLSDYTKEGFAHADKVAADLLQQIGIEDHTVVDKTAPGFFTYKPKGESEEKDFQYRGAGHLIGTHRMGKNPNTSVVNADQQSHDHPNLYIVGCGSFPTAGTANPTLTAAALSLKTADAIIAQMRLPV